ncbi:MAG: hypothetical protein H0U57_02205 [Tatlockia sp.]|nr:hypothetical protein [Tatlockia sp.]
MKTKIETVKSLRMKLRSKIYKNNVNYINKLPEFMQENISISPLHHPLESIIKNPIGKGLESPEVELIEQINNSNKFYILDHQNKILEQFFLAKQKENSTLGNFYKELDYSQFLNRLVSKKFKAIYADGRLVLPREHTPEFALAYQQKLEDSQSARKLLEKIGSSDDDFLYKEYLSLEEGAVSPFIVPQEYFLPLSDGSRISYSPVLNRINLQGGNLFEEWDNAHPYPVAISYIAAPEFRNCFSLQYDVLACVRFQDTQNEAVAYFESRQAMARQQAGFSSVISLIYGEENALTADSSHTETISFENPVFGKGVFFVNAYKKRLEHNFLQLLELANFSLEDQGNLTIKGMSLGAFAIQQLVHPMETIFMDTLKETLTKLNLSKIQKIDLINFPSAINKYPNQQDRNYVLSLGSSTKRQDIKSQNSNIEIYDCLGAPLKAQSDLHIATHFCGDSLSYPGNEVHAGVPAKISSDDSVMYYAGAGYSMIKDIESANEKIKEKTYLLSNNKATLFYIDKDKIKAESNENASSLRLKE